MSDVVDFVEEFYNSCHSKDSGKFCGAAAKGKGVIRIPMSKKAGENYARAAAFRKRKTAGLKREAAAAKGAATRKANQAARKPSDDSVPKAKGSDDRFIRKDVKGIAPVTGRKIGTSKTDANNNRVNDGYKENAFKRSKLGAEFDKPAKAAAKAPARAAKATIKKPADNSPLTKAVSNGKRLTENQLAAFKRSGERDVARWAKNNVRDTRMSRGTSTRTSATSVTTKVRGNRTIKSTSAAVKAAAPKASTKGPDLKSQTDRTIRGALAAAKRTKDSANVKAYQAELDRRAKKG